MQIFMSYQENWVPFFEHASMMSFWDRDEIRKCLLTTSESVSNRYQLTTLMWRFSVSSVLVCFPWKPGPKHGLTCRLFILESTPREQDMMDQKEWNQEGRKTYWRVNSLVGHHLEQQCLITQMFSRQNAPQKG